MMRNCFYNLLMLILCSSCTQLSTTIDIKLEEAKIKELIDLETEYFVSRNRKGFLNLYADETYTIHNLPGLAGVIVRDQTLTDLEQVVSRWEDGAGISFEPPKCFNWRISFHGDVALVIFDQITRIDNVDYSSVETRVGIKQKEDWKLLYVSTIIYDQEIDPKEIFNLI